MKVLHVIPYASAIYGGPVAVVEQMAEALARLGVSMDVATTTANGAEELDVPIGVPLLREAARYFYFPRQGPKFWMYSRPLRNWLDQRVADYDLVHVHGLFAYPTLPACAAARRAGKPYVITPHGVLDPWSLSQKAWKKWPYLALLEYRNLVRASAIHVTASLEAASIARLGLARRMVTIPLSVDIPSPCTRLGREAKPLSVLFLSRLHLKKGIPILFEALAKLCRRSGIAVELKIAGQGSDEYVSELRVLAESLGILGHVEFLGLVQGESKVRVLEEADLFVLPSYQENFSLAAAEALAAGLPVILSDQVGIAQEVHDAAAGLVVPADAPEALADAILKLADPEARRIAGANARKLAEDRFSQAQFGRALFNLYHEVLSRHAARDGSARGIT